MAWLDRYRRVTVADLERVASDLAADMDRLEAQFDSLFVRVQSLSGRVGHKVKSEQAAAQAVQGMSFAERALLADALADAEEDESDDGDD